MMFKVLRVHSTILVFAIGFSVVGCSTMSNLPETDNVKVSREEPDSECSPLGKLEGRTRTVKGKAAEALEDLKHEAARKGANYLVVKQYSGTETAVTGLAYNCP